MSLSAIVTKKSVSGTQPRINTITFTLVITDTAGVGFTQDFSCEFREGESIPMKVTEITEKMQQTILDYKKQMTIFNSAALNTAVTNIQGGLVL